MSQDQDPTRFEVLPPAETQLGAYRSQPASRALGEFLLTVPVLVPVPQPVIARADCEGSFAHRLGAAVIFSIQAFQFYLSPSGAFGAFFKFFLRWFIFLVGVVLLLGIPTFIAAQFIASVSALLYAAAQNFFWSVCYFLGGCALLAAAITLAFYMLTKRKSK